MVRYTERRVGDLLVLMQVLRSLATLLELHLRNHHTIAVD